MDVRPECRMCNRRNYRSTMETTRLVIITVLLGLILQANAQIPDACITSTTNRAPENTDINVTCGTQYMDLSIYICPMYQALYNESLMVVNNQLSNSLCYGKADWTVTPPVLRFRFPINDTNVAACKNVYKVTSQVGSGAFADFSNVQYVNISGTVNSIDPSAGAITYRPQIMYKYSCNYPMQYLLNNTQIGCVNIAIRDNNGSFISTLSMQLYQDANYQQVLTVPPTGINLKTKIYVNVKATNLTDRFNLLLDRCYATTSPYPVLTTYYDLFVGCNRDAQTKIELNGVSQTARFSFEAFRFVEHKNLTVSTFYLHCATRLCEVSTCASLLPNCGTTQNRRRREADMVPTNTTITSPPIVVGEKSAEPEPLPLYGAAPPAIICSSPLLGSLLSLLLFSWLP